MSTTPAITIAQAVEALTFEVDGKKYGPPMLDELYSDVIIGNVVKVLGALETLSVLQAEAELNDVGEGIDNSDCLFAQHMLFRSLEYSLVVANRLIQEGQATINPPKAPKPSNRQGGVA